MASVKFQPDYMTDEQIDEYYNKLDWVDMTNEMSKRIISDLHQNRLLYDWLLAFLSGRPMANKICSVHSNYTNDISLDEFNNSLDNAGVLYYGKVGNVGYWARKEKPSKEMLKSVIEGCKRTGQKVLGGACMNSDTVYIELVRDNNG